MSRGIGDSNVLQKRIPRSARYDNVRAKTDTGASMSKHMARVNEIQNNYRIQKGEERVCSYIQVLHVTYCRYDRYFIKKTLTKSKKVIQKN